MLSKLKIGDLPRASPQS